MSIWPWIAGGAAAYLVLKPKTTVPATGAPYTPTAAPAGTTPTDLAMRQLTSELDAQVPSTCKSKFASAYFEAATDGSANIWLTGVLNNEMAYTDAAQARASFATIVQEACSGTTVQGWGNSYGSSYGRSY